LSLFYQRKVTKSSSPRGATRSCSRYPFECDRLYATEPTLM